MKITSDSLPDGTIVLTFILSPDDIAQYQSLSDQPELTPTWNPFERKTKYCVSCENDPSGVHRETIEAYGDIHAGIIALAMCGPRFGMYKGECLG